MQNGKNKMRYNGAQLTVLALLRMLIGWHFLYEGIVKLLNPYWSSAGYLREAKWILADFFTSIAASPTWLRIVDFLNVWGLILIGLGLIAGCLTRTATISGILLLLLYYLCNPPLVGYAYSAPTEGSYIIVNKILIEACALLALAFFPTGRIVGIDRLFHKRKSL